MNLKMTTAAAIAAGMMVGGGASAAVISADFAKSDCSGYFGTGFDACQIFASDNQDVKLSPVIAKYSNTVVESGGLTAAEADSADDDDLQINSLFDDTIDGTEFTFSGHSGPVDNLMSGDWSYTPGEGDPGMRYWATKFGNSFRLFWVVDQSVVDDGLCKTPDSFACMKEAIAQTSGAWSTNDQNGLSHLTFYDTEGPTVIPLPAAGWLLLAGIGGLAAFRRRKSL